MALLFAALCCGLCRLDAVAEATPGQRPIHNFFSHGRIAILGSTGSIVAGTLTWSNPTPSAFAVVSLAAGRNVEAAFGAGPALETKAHFRFPPLWMRNLRSQLRTAG